MRPGDAGTFGGTMGLLAGTESFITGLLYSVRPPAHVVSLIGLGLLAGRAIWSTQARTLAAFAFGLVSSLGAIAWGAGETPASDVLLAMALLCGLIAATGITVSAWFTAPAALVSGTALGLDSPPDAILLREAVLMLIGTACGDIALLAMMSAAASALSRLWRGIVIRVAGSWIAAIALLVLALRWT